MVTDAIQREKEATEKEVVMAMDSDANLPSSSDNDDDDYEMADEGAEAAESAVSVKR